MTPPKVRFVRPNKALRAQKSFLGPPKKQKIDFLKKMKLYDYMLHTLGDSHSTQLQGPIGCFCGEFI